MHHGTCVTHVPWCMSGSLTGGGGENVPGIPGACTTRNFAYLVRSPWPWSDCLSHVPLYKYISGVSVNYLITDISTELSFFTKLHYTIYQLIIATSHNHCEGTLCWYRRGRSAIGQNHDFRYPHAKLVSSCQQPCSSNYSVYEGDELVAYKIWWKW